MIYLLS